MRYQEVVRRYLSVRGASSREWALSDTLVMCVEIDMSPAYARGLFANASSSHHTVGGQFLRVTLFRVPRDGEPRRIIGAGDGDALTPNESANLQAASQWVADWVTGDKDSLPDSTSTAIAQRLRATNGGSV